MYNSEVQGVLKEKDMPMVQIITKKIVDVLLSQFLNLTHFTVQSKQTNFLACYLVFINVEVSNFFYDELTKNNYILYAALVELAVGMVIKKRN